MNQSDHHALIDAIYGAILAPDGFNGALQILKSAFGVESTYMLHWDRPSDLIRVVGMAGLMPEFLADYESYYQFEDPTKDEFPNVIVGDWWIDTTRLGLRRMRSSVFHQEFLRSYDMTSFMATPILRSSDNEVALGLVRAHSEGVFTPATAATMQPYIPHLGRAVMLRERMRQLNSAVALTQALLERLPFGVAIIDPRLGVLSHNTRGRTWIAALGPPSKWHHRMPGCKYSFEHMIREACKAQYPAPVQAMMLRTPQQATCRLLVLPLPAAHFLSLGGHQSAALAVFSDSRASSRLLPDVLKQLYGLNRSESRLAMRMADGSRLKDVAATLCITQETARSALKIIFRKTGTGSQAQLVKLLSVLTAVSAPT